MKIIHYLQSRPERIRKIILFSTVGILTAVLLFFWVKKLASNFSKMDISKTLQLESVGREIKSGVLPVKDSINALKGVLEKNKGELQKLEEKIRKTESATAEMPQQ